MSERCWWTLIGLAALAVAVCGVFLLVGFVPPSGPAPRLHERTFCLTFGIAAGLLVAAMVGQLLGILQPLSVSSEDTGGAER